MVPPRVPLVVLGANDDEEPGLDLTNEVKLLLGFFYCGQLGFDVTCSPKNLLYMAVSPPYLRPFNDKRLKQEKVLHKVQYGS